jgi:predicted nuclease of restriction endonuclease-like (RecB) superfamily
MKKSSALTTATFADLVDLIRQTHQELAAQASKAVNVSLTFRNWLIGRHIAEYELRGQDRAQYGEQLLTELARELKAVSNCNRRQLYRYLRFYRLYPAIVGTLPPQFKNLPATPATTENAVATKVGTASPQSAVPVDQLISRLSYSHLELIVDLENTTQRAFYELEAIRGNWSVRELKRQIGSLYFERSGLSHNKAKLSGLANQSAEQNTHLNIRDPYVFEFLGLQPAEVMSESHLEQQLIEKLQKFLLELGHGFCFEARQKRILIGDEHFFIDLVFYHRILKCHVLVELKLERFSHQNLGQLNTYVSWYRTHMMTEGDNPPIGILLCTDKNQSLAEYALAGMDNQLFVAKYQLELPKKEDMQRFIDEQLHAMDALSDTV